MQKLELPNGEIKSYVPSLLKNHFFTTYILRRLYITLLKSYMMTVL